MKMQFSDVLCYIVLMVTLAASCVEARIMFNEINDPQYEKRIRRRESTVLVDSYPYQRIVERPKTIYRRISQSVQPKSKFSPTPKKYSTKPRIPLKPVNPNSVPPKRGYRPRKPYYPKNSYSTSKQRTKPTGHSPSYFIPANRFAEPPVKPSHIYQLPLRNNNPPNQGYGEPPVNSYGEPIKPVYEDEFPTGYDLYNTKPQGYKVKQEFDPWDFPLKEQAEPLHKFANKPNPIFVASGNEFYDDINADFNVDEAQILPTYSKPQKSGAKKPQAYNSGYAKTVKMPWKLKKESSDIIVGGQYAEPPARVVGENAKSNKISMTDDADSDDLYISSATGSPYVNYKNSNLAFSPQNLNDAFSITN